MPTKHALLSASSSERWIHCPPSARLSESYEDKGSDYAAEGTDAHSLCEFKLKTALGIEAKDPTDGLTYYDQEMDDCATGYAAYVLEQVEAAKETCSDPVVLIEQRVDFSRWVEQGFGTADCIIIADGTLQIIDFKYGLGVLVSAEENPQMMCYALGALELFDDIYDISTVRMTIYQPRRDNLSTYELSKEDLFRWAEEILKPAADLAFAGDGNFLCGEWCGFCKAKNACRARAAANLELAKYEFKLPPLLTDVVYQTLIKLCVDICKRYGKKKLLWLGDKDKTLNYTPAADEMIITVHRWFANKSCPGEWLYSRLSDLSSKVTAELGGNTTTEPAAATDNEKAIWDYLYGKIGNAYGVAGLMGNLFAESALKPNNLQNTFEKSLGLTDAQYTAAVDDGSYTNFIKDSAGYGLAQWTYWSRKQALQEYAKATGKSIGDLDMQLGFIWKELSEGYKTLLKTLQTATSVMDASTAVLTQYERPADQGASVQAKRAGYGQTYYDKFAGAVYPEKLTTGYYRVRKSWSDSKSQLGAYRVLANAKKQADDNPGFYVFANDGTRIYPEQKAVTHLEYTVVKGDSLWGIAQRFLEKGNRYPEIMTLNGLTSTIIYSGQKLKLPN